ncbi:hypothetical protein H1C71_041870 [Ictidomys tridecemlineatus]|nr:hypothetical protein H1C71_041870 [Ictidomys tridecemlineatus]
MAAGQWPFWGLQRAEVRGRLPKPGSWSQLPRVLMIPVPLEGRAEMPDGRPSCASGAGHRRKHPLSSQETSGGLTCDIPPRGTYQSTRITWAQARCGVKTSKISSNLASSAVTQRAAAQLGQCAPWCPAPSPTPTTPRGGSLLGDQRDCGLVRWATRTGIPQPPGSAEARGQPDPGVLRALQGWTEPYKEPPDHRTGTKNSLSLTAWRTGRRQVPGRAPGQPDQMGAGQCMLPCSFLLTSSCVWAQAPRASAQPASLLCTRASCPSISPA